MAYRPFFEAESEGTRATFANPATFQPNPRETVAVVASVAEGYSETEAGAIDTPELSLADLQTAFEERAGILEFDCRLPRAEAERLARIQISNIVH